MKWIVPLCFLAWPLFGADNEENFEELSEQELIAEIDTTEIAAADNLGPTAAGFPADTDFGPEGDTFIDQRVLRDFIESRGLIKCRQKAGSLTIYGDVRARWTAANESVNGVAVRGSGTSTAINRYKSEINLFFDYSTKKGWGSTKLKWANFDGSDGGTPTRVSMDRAFVGYDIWHEGENDFYIEVGRSKLNLLFDSRVEFSGNFDGLHIFLTHCLSGIGQLQLHGGPFIVDSFTSHYAWVVEAGVIEWMGTGFSAKYSIVDWRRASSTRNYGNLSDSGSSNLKRNPRYAFIVSQVLLGYQRKLEWVHCKSFYLYWANLVNTAAKKQRTSNYRKLNAAWYAGFTLGKLCKAYDWSIDINYQSVEAQAVPEFDLSGIGHGNAADTLYSDAVIQGLAPPLAAGFSNYRGWQMSALYAMTDSLSLRAVAEWTRPKDHIIGGDFDYRSFSFNTIYAF